VSTCVTDRAKRWSLPKRANGSGAPSSTRISLDYVLSAAKPEAPAKK